jgi:predicted GNAT family N-acyltransferase
MTAAVRIRRACSGDEQAAAIELRRRVFCEEQGVPSGVEMDGRDDEALHVVAVRDADVIGTCRLLVQAGTAKLGRMAVAAGERRQGLGTRLLHAAEREAREAGARRIALHAQEHARALYAANGYTPYGEPFVEAGIPHVAMEKALA